MTTTNPKTPQRIYAIQNMHAEASKPPFLVKASTPAQAIRHVVKSQFTAEVASQDQLVAALTAGAVVELASSEVAE